MAEGSYGNKYFTTKNIIIYLVVAGLVYAAVYYLFLRGDNAPYTNPTAQTEEVDAMTMTVVLDAQNESGQSGIATLTENNGQTTVELLVDNPPLGALQPAHIHTGACPTPGEVVYGLENVVDGSSVTVLDVDLATLQGQLPLAINVHLSPEEAQTYVSCGDLQ